MFRYRHFEAALIANRHLMASWKPSGVYHKYANTLYHLSRCRCTVVYTPILHAVQILNIYAVIHQTLRLSYTNHPCIDVFVLDPTQVYHPGKPPSHVRSDSLPSSSSHPFRLRFCCTPCLVRIGAIPSVISAFAKPSGGVIHSSSTQNFLSSVSSNSISFWTHFCTSRHCGTKTLRAVLSLKVSLFASNLAPKADFAYASIGKPGHSSHSVATFLDGKWTSGSTTSTYGAQETAHVHGHDKAKQTWHAYQNLEGAADVPLCLAAFLEIDVDVELADSIEKPVLPNQFEPSMSDNAGVVWAVWRSTRKQQTTRYSPARCSLVSVAVLS